MTQELTVFKDKRIHIEMVNGEPFFCINDICGEVEIKNVGNVIKRLRDAGIHIMDVSVQTDTIMRTMAFTNEAGLYAIIGKSRKPKCKELYQQLINAIPGMRKSMTMADPMDAVKVLAQGMVSIDERLKKLEAKREEHALLEAPPIPIRKQIVRLVRDFMSKHPDRYAYYDDAFHSLYREFKYTYGIDVALCAANRDMKVIEYIEQIDKLPELLAVANKLFGGS